MGFDKDFIYDLINLVDRLEDEASGSSMYIHPNKEDYEAIKSFYQENASQFTLVNTYPRRLFYKGLNIFDAVSKEEQEQATAVLSEEVEQCLNP